MAAKFPEFDILALALAPLDLPMQDLDDQEDFALSKKENEERFGAPVRDNDLARAIEERIPDKTKKTTQWAEYRLYSCATGCEHQHQYQPVIMTVTMLFCCFIFAVYVLSSFIT